MSKVNRDQTKARPPAFSAPSVPTSGALPAVRHRVRTAPVATKAKAPASQARGSSNSGPTSNSPPETNPQGDYEVGYGKPPRHTQFQKGQSGNPSGRPKKSKNTRTIAKAELDAPLTFHSNGKTKTASARELIIKQLVKKAVEKGDLKSFFALLGLAGESHSAGLEKDTDGASDQSPMTDAEKEILAFVQRDVLAQAGVPDEAIDRALALLGLAPAPSSKTDGGSK